LGPLYYTNEEHTVLWQVMFSYIVLYTTEFASTQLYSDKQEFSSGFTGEQCN